MQVILGDGYAATVSGYVITMMLGLVCVLLAWIAKQAVEVKYGMRDMKRVVRRILIHIGMDDTFSSEDEEE